MRLTSTLLACVLCLSASTAFGELIYNGDFEAGTTGFASSYALVVENTGVGQYGILSTPNGVGNPVPWNSSFADFTDKSGSGLMFVANGSTNALLDPVIWAQEITVEKDVTYNFSFWGATASATSSGSNAPALTMSVSNGSLLASATLDLDPPSPPATGEFVMAGGTFTATADGPLFVRIRNNYFGMTGNDFAIDNISVTVVPEPSSLALLGIGSLVGLGVYTRRRRKNA